MNTKPWVTAAAIVAACLVVVRAEAAPKKKKSEEKARVAAQDEPAAPSAPTSAPAPGSAPAPAPAPAEQPAPAEPPPEKPKPTPSSEGLSGADGAPPGEPAPAAEGLDVKPYLLASGGVKGDLVKDQPGEDKQGRVSTFALSRFGVRARWGTLVSAESELMASGGVSLHGTSAYEGQAALQVRQQVVRLSDATWSLEVGRFIDEASVDYFSAHVGETFLQDTATRDPLLFDGFNLGNGVRGTFAIVPGVLRAGLTFNAGNPVSTTGSLMIGGTYPPFERFYTQPYQAVAQGANNFPDDSFHIMMVTPALLLDTPLVDAKLAVQAFDVDTNMSSSSNDHIRGYNARATVRLKLFESMLVPFASAAYTRNDTLVTNDLSKRARDRYQAVDLGGGVDLDWARRFQCAYDCADGIGVQYQQVQFQIGDGLVTTNRYLNLGSTIWISPHVSLGARIALWQAEPELQAATGERSALVALRFVMP